MIKVSIFIFELLLLSYFLSDFDRVCGRLQVFDKGLHVEISCF